MKSILRTVMMVFLMITANAATAQVFRISTFGQESILFGDFTKKEINNPGAGYVDYATPGGLEFNYYPKNKLGFGVRWTVASYERDLDSYERDLKRELNMSNNTFHLTQPFAYWAIGSDIGLSYVLDLNEKWQIEPYIYLGFKVLYIENIDAIYSDTGTTFQYQVESPIFVGFSYAPGAKVHWNVAKRFGLYFSLEYQGAAFAKDDETRISFSTNTLNITSFERSYGINSLNIGLGLAVRFGKGLEQ